MALARHDIVIQKGATETVELTWKDSAGALVDLTGYTAVAQFREREDSAGSALLELTSAGGAIVLGGAAGTIVITITAAQTAAFSVRSAVWSLELTSGGVVTTLLAGAVRFKQEIAR